MPRYIEVAPGVTVSQHPNGNTNATIVSGAERTLTVDSHHFPEDGEALDKKAQEVSGRLSDFLVLTHSHLDHVGGSLAFSCPVVASLETAEVLRDLPRFATLQVKIPEIVFGNRLGVDLGDEMAEVILTGGHLPGHAVVYLPQRAVLIAADLVFGNQALYMGDGAPLRYLDSLAELTALPFKTVIPGHGNPGGRELVERTVKAVGGFVNQVRRMAEIHRTDDGVPDARAAAADLAGRLEIPDGYLVRLTSNVERLLMSLK